MILLESNRKFSQQTMRHIDSAMPTGILGHCSYTIARASASDRSMDGLSVCY